MKILFVGRQIKGLWIREEAEHYGYDFEIIKDDTSIKNHVNPILEHKDCSYMVFDVEQYADSAETIAEQIGRIQEVNNARAIIYAPGYSPTSSVIVKLLQQQLKYFIFGVNLSEQKDQLGKCLNGYYDSHSDEEFGYVEPVLEEKETKQLMNFKNIGIAGATSRIGTTTQAIQIVKYLMFNGYKACYIQMNSHRYVEELAEWFETDTSKEDETIGKVSYKSVDMFYDLSKLQSILKLGYDYYVYDYGVFSDPDFNKVSFLERDHQIFCCGAKPNELTDAYTVIENAFYNDVAYIYVFVPESDREAVKELMEQKKDRTFFADYNPDPFLYSNAPMYSQMIPVENRIEVQEPPKKGFFKDRKKVKEKKPAGKIGKLNPFTGR